MKSLRFAVALFAGISLASVANAAVDVQTITYSGGMLSGFSLVSGSRTITGFDVGKGNLTAVTFDISGSETVDVTPRAAGNLPYTINGGSSLYFANSFVDFVQTGSGVATFTGAPISLAALVSGSQTFTSNFGLFTSGDLSSYVLSDSPVVKIDGTTVGGNPNPPTVSATSINVKISYIYDAAGDTVPEPATWAMMLVGFGAIGGAMRHRQRSGHRFA